jgi:hypothetical protein
MLKIMVVVSLTIYDSLFGMPSVNFIGSIDHASGGDAGAVSLTWEILPGMLSISFL